MSSTTRQCGSDEFEILSFIENGKDSKIYDVKKTHSDCYFTMEVTRRLWKTDVVFDSKLQKHSKNQSPYLVNLCNYFCTKSRDYFILTHTKQKNSLVSMLSLNKKLNENEILFIITELIVAINHLHSCGVVYGGVSKEDIYFDDTGHILLKRTYNNQAYWSEDECFQCLNVTCANIYHTIKKPSEAEKCVDWMSVEQIYTVLSSNNQLSTIRDFIKDQSRSQNSRNGIKDKQLLLNMNLKQAESKQIAVPIYIQQFVNGLLNKLVNKRSPHIVTEQQRHARNISERGHHDLTEDSSKNDLKYKSKAWAVEPTSINNLLVKGVRRKRSGKLQNQHNHDAITEIKNNENSAVIRNLQQKRERKNSNLFEDFKDRTLKKSQTSLETYRKRLEEISEVLEKNRRTMENINMSEKHDKTSLIRTQETHLNKQLQLKCASPGKLTEKQETSQIAIKIYSENDSIRKILLKYGFLNEASILQGSNNDFTLNEPEILKNNTNITKSRCCKNMNSLKVIKNTMEKSLTPKVTGKVDPKLIKSRDIPLGQEDKTRDKQVYLHGKEATEEEKPAETDRKNQCDIEVVSPENHPKRSTTGNNVQDKTYNSNQTRSRSMGENDRIIDNWKAGCSACHGKSDLLNQLQNLVGKIKQRSRTMSRDQHDIKRHLSDITPLQLSYCERSDGNQLTRSLTVPGLTNTFYLDDILLPTSNWHRKLEVGNSFDCELQDADENDQFIDEDVFENHNPPPTSTDKSQVEPLNGRVLLEETLPRQCEVRVWKPRQPDQKFLLEEKIKIKEKISCCHDCGKQNSSKQTDDDVPSAYSTCENCAKSRTERKEAIIELIQTEINYGHDLRILKQEFYNPMKTNAVCTQEELNKIFSNLQELLDVNSKLCAALQHGLEFCSDHDDDDFLQLSVGEIFLNCADFFEAYEIFCVRQHETADILENLQKKSDILRIFLNVSSKENSRLRKMDLKSFLTMPIQRIMKYPLLLNRIYKNTSSNCADKNVIKVALYKIEDQIRTINHIVRRNSTVSDGIKKRYSLSLSQQYLDQTELSKPERFISNLLEWKQDETTVLLQNEFDIIVESLVDLRQWSGRLLTKSIRVTAFLCIHCASDNLAGVVNSIIEKPYSTNTICSAKEAMVVLIKKKNNDKCVIYKSPLNLNQSVVSTNPKIPSKFEILQRDKVPYLFAPDTEKVYNLWRQAIELTIKSLELKWRRRRGGMSNIMIPTML